MLGVNPNGIANALMLIALTTSAFFAYLLAARLTGHRGAAIVAGLVFAFSSYRRVHLPHLELQWAQWMPLAFWAWHRLLDTGRMRDGLLCAGAVLLQLLSSLYYAVFLAIGLAVVGAATLIARRGRLAGPALVGLCAGAVIAAGVAVSYAKPYAYARARVGERSIQETTRYSATPASFLTVSPDSVVYRAVLPHEGEGETELFPGITPVVLAGAALVPPTTATAVAYGLSLVVAGDMALGTNGLIFPIARKHVAVLRALRAPARFAILVQLTLGVLAAMGLARAAARWPRIGPTLVVASACLVMVEYANGPLPVQRLPVRPPPIYAWLATQPKLVTLELPTPPPHALPLHDPFYMYASTWHWQPLVNGYSGHYSARYVELTEALRASARTQVDRRAHRDGRAAHPGAREAVPGGHLSAAHRRHRGAPDVPPRNGVGGSPRRGPRLRVPARLRTVVAVSRSRLAALRRGRTWRPASRPTGSRPSSIRRCCRRTGSRRCGDSR